jgi:hypothetical protein
MLYAFAFGRVGVVASDLYLLDPRSGPEGSEQGVRLEVRMFEALELPGSGASARRIAVEQPVWRADLLESLANPGSLDRAHHHPRFTDWEPGERDFVEEMTSDPIGFVGSRLSDLDALLDDAGIRRDEVDASDADDLRRAVPQILDAVQRLLGGVRAGTPGGTDAPPPAFARVGWL